MSRRRSKKFFFRYRPNVPSDDYKLDNIREHVKTVNAELKSAGSDLRYKVLLTPGPVARAYAWKYENKHKRKVRLEDAKYVSVYVVPQGVIRRT